MISIARDASHRPWFVNGGDIALPVPGVRWGRVKSVQLLFKCIIEFGSGTTQFGAMAGIVLAWLETAADCDAPALAAILIRRQGSFAALRKPAAERLCIHQSRPNTDCTCINYVLIMLRFGRRVH
jgi:hypothetical protein